MPILFRERDAVVAVPRIKHGLVSVGWNCTSLVKRGLGVVSLSGGMSIESLEIDSASWFACFSLGPLPSGGTKSPVFQWVQAQ